MRNISIILTTVILVFFSCKKNILDIRFKMNYDTELTISSGMGINLPFNIYTPDITTNSEEQFAANDTRKDKVKEVKLESMQLSITSPSGSNFDFLKSIEFYIKADGLDEVKYAYIDEVPDGKTILNLNTVDVNLADYLKKDKFSLRVKTVQDEMLGQDTDIKSASVFAVTANPLKK